MIGQFLMKNGFKRGYHDEIRDHYYNNRCSIAISSSDEGSYIEIYQCKKGSVYNGTGHIYWLIGYLTYYDLMDKNYKQ